jgi:hypothetical protein
LGTGLIDYPLARTIVSRGALLRDPDALRRLDQALAVALRSWEPTSRACQMVCVAVAPDELEQYRWM